MNSCSSLTLEGLGKLVIAATFLGLGTKPHEATLCPKKESSVLPKMHLFGLMTRLYSLSFWNSFPVLLLVAAGHQDVVQVDEHEVQVCCDRVHQALEGLHGILQAKGHTRIGRRA